MGYLQCLTLSLPNLKCLFWTTLTFEIILALTLSPLAVNLMTFANNLDPDEAPQNVGSHLRSKLFETQTVYQQNFGRKLGYFPEFYNSLHAG